MPTTPPPTVLESYAEQNQPKTRKRRPNWKALLFVVIFFGGLLIAVFLQSPLSSVSYIEVLGNQHIRYDEILRTAEVEKGMSFLAIDKAEVKEKILRAYPRVLSVDVQVSWQGEVTIAVVEKALAGLIVQDASIYHLLQDGTVLAGTEKLGVERVPAISLDQPTPLQNGQKVTSPDLLELAKQIPEVDRAVLDNISEIRIASDGPWKIYMCDKFEVRIPARQFADKMKSYLEYRNALASDTAPGIINVFDAIYMESFKPQDKKGE
ncbi:cell division protein FtsQ/DivIB [Tumebacillus lipolyticus]|uniref:Cell division protein FtsQ/DivIB n=1 Tax=Tumebacillus lipolyticus TaxID=1280370 RepID=A0ABW4ZXS8_9BACL